MTIPERLLILKEARERLAILKMTREDSYARWVVEHDLLLRQIEGATLTVAENEELIKADVLARYEVEGNKHPYPGVEIKEKTTLEYNLKEALTWGYEKRMALTLDKFAFEKIAKATPLSFVKVSTIPQAQIAKDLEEALKSA